MAQFFDTNLRIFVVGALLVGALDACGSDSGSAPRAQLEDPATGDSKADAGGSHMADPPASDDDGDDDGQTAGKADASVDDAGDAPVVPAPPDYAIHLQPTKQVKGDADKGYQFLVNGDYITLGLPYAGFSAVMSPLEARDTLPGRTGDNAKVPYQYNVVTDADGVKLASGNCLQCHASHWGGKVLVGLGNPNPAGNVSVPNIAGVLLNSTPAEAAVALKYSQRGVNSIQFGPMNVFPELASHHDPKTLEWSEEPLYSADTGLQGAVDIPPWWRTKKKAGLYYTGVGLGQQSRHMSFQSVFSIRNTQEADHIFENFVDVAEYIRSIEPPPFPGTIDKDLAAQGEEVFLANCATCHGTYGEHWTYPNVVIPYEEVGTDPSLATNNWVNQATEDWFAESYYAGNGVSAMKNNKGYCAPPLDGIWVTAPFFHNGSVPTLEGVIDPSKRPAVWSTGFGDDDYDFDRVGWKLSEDPTLRKHDTTTPGNSNQGHTYGEVLDAEQKRAVLEYLKTL